MRRTILCTLCLLLLPGSVLGGASDMFRTARQMASRLEARAQRMLDGTLGPGQARVLVTLELDASRVDEVRVEAMPGPARVRRRAESDGPTGHREAEGALYEVSRRVRLTRQVHPRIARLSAVLLVDRKVRYEIPVPAVKAAIGFSERRGDRFAVVERKR